MKNIEKFKKVHYYGANGELSKEELKNKLGITEDDYKTSDECAYQCAYDLSEDWSKETPTWKDVQEAYKRGVEDTLIYAQRIINELLKKNIMKYYE